jgi:hypothetical protein
MDVRYNTEGILRFEPEPNNAANEENLPFQTLSLSGAKTFCHDPHNIQNLLR